MCIRDSPYSFPCFPCRLKRSLSPGLFPLEGLQPITENIPGEPVLSLPVSYTHLEVEVQKYAKEQRVLFITGQKSLDTDWDSYVTNLKNLGLDRLVEDVYKRQPC